MLVAAVCLSGFPVLDYTTKTRRHKGSQDPFTRRGSHRTAIGFPGEPVAPRSRSGLNMKANS
jgi:hypothetical protein